MNEGKLNVKSKQNKLLLSLENWHRLFSVGNEEEIKDELHNMSSAIDDVQEVKNIIIL